MRGGVWGARGKGLISGMRLIMCGLILMWITNLLMMKNISYFTSTPATTGAFISSITHKVPKKHFRYLAPSLTSTDNLESIFLPN